MAEPTMQHGAKIATFPDSEGVACRISE